MRAALLTGYYAQQTAVDIMTPGRIPAWAKFLPEIEQRVAVLDAAVRELTGGSLSEVDRTAAHAAAHVLKLTVAKSPTQLRQ